MSASFLITVEKCRRIVAVSVACTLVTLVACSTSEANPTSLERRFQEVVDLENNADWEALYNDFLPASDKRNCSLETYAEHSNQQMSMIRTMLGGGEFSVRDVEIDVRDEVARVTFAILLEGDVVHRVTSADPDYWLYEEGKWRDLTDSESSPCFSREQVDRAESAFTR